LAFELNHSKVETRSSVPVVRHRRKELKGKMADGLEPSC
jgi:hypothetical protein